MKNFPQFVVAQQMHLPTHRRPSRDEFLKENPPLDPTPGLPPTNMASQTLQPTPPLKRQE